MPLLAGTARPGDRFTAEPLWQTSLGGATDFFNPSKAWAFVSIHLPRYKCHFTLTSLHRKKPLCWSETAQKSSAQEETLCFHLPRFASASCTGSPSQRSLCLMGKSTPNKYLPLTRVSLHYYINHHWAHRANGKTIGFCPSTRNAAAIGCPPASCASLGTAVWRAVLNSCPRPVRDNPVQPPKT